MSEEWTRDEAVARLAELHTRQGLLLEELNRSLALRDLWPEAFKVGKVSTHVVGNNRHGKKTFRLEITRSDGEVREFNLASVPVILRDGWEWDEKNGSWLRGGQP